jgi:N6-adenosine-specific RNA methylase IME4
MISWRVSPGPRLDMFSREKREGFDQHGNEIDFFGDADAAR